MVERLVCNEDVAGSNPVGSTNKIFILLGGDFIYAPGDRIRTGKGSGNGSFPLEENAKNRGFLEANPVSARYPCRVHHPTSPVGLCGMSREGLPKWDNKIITACRLFFCMPKDSKNPVAPLRSFSVGWPCPDVALAKSRRNVGINGVGSIMTYISA